MSQSPSDGLYLLDYGAGNVRSVFNAIESLGYKINLINSSADFDKAKKIIFPGVGSFGHAIDSMKRKNLIEPLLKYIQSGRPLFGICVGMQVLFQGSEESDSPGLGIFPGRVELFSSHSKSVPNIGWNNPVIVQSLPDTIDMSKTGINSDSLYYYVHSYAVPYPETQNNLNFVNTATRYGDQTFISSVWSKNIFATQFHPEKSGETGLKLLDFFIKDFTCLPETSSPIPRPIPSRTSVRVIACMDVRTNDQGDLVVTKGDQYDVREASQGNQVRNLGKPVQLAKRYYQEGADEVTFLNITSFRNTPLNDTPMLDVLRQASKSVFVPMTVGGGIRSITNEISGESWSAVQVADAYFLAGADKVSIGSDAVYSAEKLISNKGIKDGSSSIEQISSVYGSQAVVVSIDPKRVYVNDPSETSHTSVLTTNKGPNNESYCWFQCTVKGGRESRDIDVVQLSKAVSELGAGEILLNCIDKDGTNSGYDLELIKLVKSSVTIPVIASSGAGKPSDFSDAINLANADAVLAAGIFHRKEVSISEVKEYLKSENIGVRCV
ncbi:Imidazole glycerol phosphate synthase hisHF [Smittium mucronatum]|uniref:Imidazole glycerol phosphate synthase hisHF n=1 Tax=Smittium mucronatum TaxID=133383 RepID=A0A1R0GLS0_9FUNG|nr:Imidazole glycerol phosphate synthase hisHF [Smittium mucronatum]